MLFSIICLTYKRVELLEENIYSILNQSCSDWELLIINDCDAQTLHFPHSKVRIFNLKNKFKSIADKRNYGVENAMGDYILHLDDDDFLLPSYLNNLKNAINDCDILTAQRPIMYFDDFSKIYLSPVPQTNTFLYSKKIVEKFRYESVPVDEGITLNGFYERVCKNFTGSRKMMRLKPEECGHVWRQDVNTLRKYSLANFLNEKISKEKQNDILSKLEFRTGDVFLEPRWNINYTDIIQKHMKITSPLEFYKKVNGGKNIVSNIIPEKSVVKNKEVSWAIVKPSWSNALKFVEAIQSRGIISTALNVIGINNTLGDRVSDIIFKQRHLSCFGDKSINIAPCEKIKIIEGKGSFCGFCGCGEHKLAKLDGEGYTKLHYPTLECPLNKPGFSNYQGNYLSVIITALNEDPLTLNNTIKSIRDTANEDIEIIVVDDCSDTPVEVADKNVKVFRNKNRIGCAPSRHFGALQSTKKYLLFTDSHMIYANGWYDEFLKKSKAYSENVAFCGVCLGLNNKRNSLDNHCGKYNGARLSLYEENENQVLEGKWIAEKDGDEYEISCMMGAIYFINREYFIKLRGLSDLKMWGSDEPCLAIKILRTGGKMILLKNIQAGHFFRDKAPYITETNHLIYNKLRMAKTLLPNDLGKKLIEKISNDGDLDAAMSVIDIDTDTINEYKKYYDSIFTVSIEEICQKFNIKML